MMTDLKLTACHAYDTSLTRERATELVHASQLQGAFVVRPSESQKGDAIITAL